MDQDLEIRRVRAEDRGWVERLLREHWGAVTVAVHDTLYRPADLAGFIAESAPAAPFLWPPASGPGPLRVGLATYVVDGVDCEIVTLDSLVSERGIGTALIGAVRTEARSRRCQRVWLITTNDNHVAINFYERRGFRLKAIHPGAVERSRRLKPEIPLLGENGVPILDELEFEIFP